MLTLLLGGPFRAKLPTGDTPKGLSRRGQAMLAYLCCQPGLRAERGLLADLLWSDRSEEQARASLRQELSVLRRTLPDGVIGADRQAVWLDPARVRIETGGGVFLQGFDLASEGFEDWLRNMRQAANTAPPDAPSDAPGPAARPARPSLAVLPFDEIGAPEADMFADGVVEEITGALSRVDEFDVIARQSTFALRGEAIGAPEIARRLGADYLVEGSVRRAGDRVRIAAKLLRGTDGHAIWSDRFDDRLDDLFDLQDRVAALIAGQISPNLRAAEIARVRLQPPGDRSAYELYLTAYPHFWDHSRAGNDAALKRLDQSLGLDPGFGPALALRAWCVAQNLAYMYAEDPDGERPLVRRAIEKAEEHAGDHPAALTAIGAALSLATTDLDRAHRYIDRALDLDPNNAWAWMRRGWAQAYVGDADAAVASLETAERLSPLDPFRFNFILGKASAIMHWQPKAGDTSAAKQAALLIEQALVLNPRAKWIFRMLATARYYAGDLAGTQAAGAALLQAYPHLSVAYLQKALPQAAFVYELKYFESMRAAGIPDE